MTVSTPLLTPQARAEIAADPSVGGGNLLRSAIAASPDPDFPFLESMVPVAAPGGEHLTRLGLTDLDRLAQSWSVWYRRQGVARRDRVAVCLDDSVAYLVHYCALAQIGAIPVLINSHAPREVMAELCRRTAPVGVYTTAARATAAGDAFAGARWIRTVEELPAPDDGELPEQDRMRHAAEDPVAILHSSGTTGSPKPVVLTHSSIVAGPKFRLAHHTETPGRRLLMAVPQSHFGCITYAHYILLAGTPAVMARDLPGRDLAEAIGRYRPGSVMSFGHAYAELAADPPAAGVLDSVDVWIAVGDAVHRQHIDRILAARGPQHPEPAFFDLLGCTELGWGTLVQKWTRESPRNDRCAGSPVGIADVRVLRRDATETLPFEVGLLGARGPAVTPGYWSDSDASYRGRVGGYQLTGDLAYRDECGLFYQVDREVDALRTAEGTAYTVQLEELLINEIPELADCAVVGGRFDESGGDVPVAVVRTHRPGSDPHALLVSCNRLLSSAGHPPLALIKVADGDEDYPLGVTGKVLKRRLRQRYARLSEYVPGPGEARVTRAGG
jgi:acyl-coenzyme A synthetase/AMP-(fatty) acid ligase